MPADSSDPNDSSAIERDRELRLRLTRNKRQRAIYGPKHLRRRREFDRRIKRGELIICPRCSGEIGPDQEWELGHNDQDLTRSCPEHRTCNRAAANALKTSREW